MSRPLLLWAAPALQSTGVTWRPILESLTDYGQWILADPNPDMAEMGARSQFTGTWDPADPALHFGLSGPDR